MVKIGMIFNNTLRKDTTGNYCLQALAKMENIEVEHLAPMQLTDEKDLYIVIDDGIPFNWEYLKGKNVAYWAIDTHLGLEERQRNAANCAHVFIAQKNDVDKFNNAKWLPLACDPAIHNMGTAFAKEYDVCFVGHTDPKFMSRRIDMLDALFRDFPNFYYGQKFFDEATKIYAKSKVIFNCSVKNDINMRCFEVMSSGSMLLTDVITNNGFEELFVDGVHCVTYNGVEDMLEKTRHYLDNGLEREQIARAGQALVNDKHTYAARMYRLLGECGIKA